MNIEIASATDIGLVRERNEDSLAYQQYRHADVSVCIVADGVGGHAGGDVASQLSVASILDTVEAAVQKAHSNNSFDNNWLIETVENAIHKANESIRSQQTQNESLSNMASTVVVLLRHAENIVVAHAGDSRCYLCWQNNFDQITEDHTVAQQMLNDGVLNYGEFLKSHYHHILNNGLGLYDEIKISLHSGDCVNKIFLLCTDGLTDCVSDANIYSHLIDGDNLDSCAEALIQQALKGGGMDNISLILFSCNNEEL